MLSIYWLLGQTFPAGTLSLSLPLSIRQYVSFQFRPRCLVHMHADIYRASHNRTDQYCKLEELRAPPMRLVPPGRATNGHFACRLIGPEFNCDYGKAKLGSNSKTGSSNKWRHLINQSSAEQHAPRSVFSPQDDVGCADNSHIIQMAPSAELSNAEGCLPLPSSPASSSLPSASSWDSTIPLGSSQCAMLQSCA